MLAAYKESSEVSEILKSLLTDLNTRQTALDDELKVTSLPSYSSLLLSSLELSHTKKSTSLRYEPSSEPLHISTN